MSSLENKTAFEQLIARNRGRLVAISRSYGYGDAEDLLQEIFLQIWRSLATYKQQAAIDTWCYRVAINTAIAWQRSAGTRRRKIPPSKDDVTQMSGTDAGHDDCELLRQFLQTLSETDRALVLMYLEDMTGIEMAEVLGIGAGALRVRLHRVKQRLANWNVGDS